MLIAAMVSSSLPQKATAVGPGTTSVQWISNPGKPRLFLAASTNETLSVRGTVDLTNSTIKLDPFMILPGSKYTARPTNSSFSINLLDNKGKTLARYPFDPKVSTYVSQNKHRTALLSEAVPYILGTKEIVISKDSRELASRHVDDYAPKVSFISAKVNLSSTNAGENLTGNVILRWKATDADGGNLTYFILYSTDAGRSWQTLASDIKDNQLILNVAGLTGSNKALFRVIATDGVNTGIGDSNGTLSVPFLGTQGG
jgi:hypothetical protein